MSTIARTTATVPWTRRSFLTVAASTMACLSYARPRADAATLQVLADEIVPSGDGMPGASEAGALSYLADLAERDRAVRKELRDGLAAVERSARSRHRLSFARLGRAQRVAILQDIERNAPDTFASLRNLVYEAYYTQPAVWKRLGYEFVSADRQAAALDPFDEGLLTRVKQMGRLYREVR